MKLETSWTVSSSRNYGSICYIIVCVKKLDVGTGAYLLSVELGTAAEWQANYFSRVLSRKYDRGFSYEDNII